MRDGAVDFVVKPWDNERLVAALRNAYNLACSQREVKQLKEIKRELKQEEPMFWGGSPAMARIREIVEKVAATDANILITGENGTGKEMLAREIHNRSARRRELMVPVDMGAVPETLFESELFGHVKGAFTDARTDRAGKFEVADRGTLFLDEIGNLPPRLQSKLLTAIQSGRIVRLGSNTPVKVDIRLISATNRDLRRRLYEAYTSRCMDGKYDNRQLSVDIVNLRLERARMLGYENYAAYTLETNMAGTPEKVRELLLPLKDAAAGKGRAERAELEAFAVKYERDSAFRLEPWDVAFYSGKLRKAKFGSELGRMRNYLLFDNVLNDGVFYVANRLFGITLTQRTDIPVFHPDVLTFEAKDAEGRPLGLLYLDCFVRKGKRGGAWCSRLRGYSCAGEREVLPLVTISCNFSRAAEGRPKLLSTSEVKTLFHEFGHALAGFLSRGPYPQVTGSFPRDMVELPSQLNEHWAWEPEVMKHYARDYETGRPIPDALIAKFKESENFLKGLYLTDFYATALLDLEWHTVLRPVEGCDVAAFERAFLKRYDFPEHTALRFRTTYYNHIFASSYPAQYYSYTWSAVLDTDAFAAFTGTGDIFDSETARRYRRHILTEAGYDEPMAQYVRFRGAVPDVKPLMRRYGLAE